MATSRARLQRASSGVADALDLAQSGCDRRRLGPAPAAGGRGAAAGVDTGPAAGRRGGAPPFLARRRAGRRGAALQHPDARTLRPAGAADRAGLLALAAGPGQLCGAGAAACGGDGAAGRAGGSARCGDRHGPDRGAKALAGGHAAGPAIAGGGAADRRGDAGFGGDGGRLYRRRGLGRADPWRAGPGPYREDPGRRRAGLPAGPAGGWPAATGAAAGNGMMAAWAWLRANPGAFWEALVQHLALSATGLLLGVVLALPAALLLARRPRLADWASGLAGLLRTLPSLAVLAALLPLLGVGFTP